MTGIVRIRKSTKSHVSTALKSIRKTWLLLRRHLQAIKKRVELYLEDSATEIVKEKD